MNGGRHRPDNCKAVDAFAVVLFHCTLVDVQCVLCGGQYGHLTCHLTLHPEQSKVSSEVVS